MDDSRLLVHSLEELERQLHLDDVGTTPPARDSSNQDEFANDDLVTADGYMNV